MSREKEGYREELEQILSYFGNKRVLTVTDVSQYTGKTPKWCRKQYGVCKNHPLSAVQLARAMTGGN